MRQIGIALHTAQDAFEKMPPHCGKYSWPQGVETKTINPKTFEGSTPFWLLPFVDHANSMAVFDCKRAASPSLPRGPRAPRARSSPLRNCIAARPTPPTSSKPAWSATNRQPATPST
jgi:hypothetical protein